MGMYGVLCSLSQKRRALLEDDTSLVLEALHERRSVPGLLSLEKSWDALDKILAHGTTKKSAAKDAILGHSGTEFGQSLGFEIPKLLEAKRVKAVAKALGELSDDFVKENYPALADLEVHGEFGRRRAGAVNDYKEELEALGLNEEIPEDLIYLSDVFARVLKFYVGAAEREEAVIALVV
ncbi:MAG: hypothetical protein ACI9KE_001650 [Polyangiales bacterium]|jgi:hypothetical protein